MELLNRINMKSNFSLYIIIFLNILIYILLGIKSSSLYKIDNYILIENGALLYDSLNNYDFLKLILNLFLHADIFHLLTNMLLLLIFGILTLKSITNSYFLFLFFFNGFIASISSILFSNNILTIGASGSILGIISFYIIINSKNVYKTILVILLISLFQFFNINVTSSINHTMHIVGFISGIILGCVHKKLI